MQIAIMICRHKILQMLFNSVAGSLLQN